MPISFFKKDVRGLDIAMHKTPFVRGIEGIADAADDLQTLIKRQGPAGDLLEPGFKVRPLYVAHSDMEAAVKRPRRIDRDHVGVVYRRSTARLVFEASPKYRVICPLGSNDLERDPPPETFVFGQIDRAHSAAAEQRHDSKLAQSVAGGKLVTTDPHHSTRDLLAGISAE